MRNAHASDFPWWLLAIAGMGAWFLYRIVADDLYAQVLFTLSKGVGITLFVTGISFSMASVLGLLLAMATLSRFVVLRQVARFYIEMVRGLPIMVLLLYVAFVFAPAAVAFVNVILEQLGINPWKSRDFSFLWRAIMALTIGYSAFIAEVFRAGLQSVDPGQIEAAKTLGLKPMQIFRLIVLPQALRTILPPLGNDFIAMIKDSSLVSVLGVMDITQLSKVTAAGNFRYFETYNVAAFLYLSLTISLSLVLRRLEKRLNSRHVAP